jgi:sec-independent protein translocase protein TatA
MELFSPGHLIPLLIVVAVLFFGWKQLPDMARSVGRSLRIFKTEMKGMTDDDKTRDEQKAIEEKKAEPASVPPSSAPADKAGPESPTSSAE